MSLRIPPLALLVAVGALMYGVAPGMPMLASLNRAGSGLLLMVLGGAVALAGVMQFRRAHTTVDPREPNKTTSLVTDGVYRFSRNPMYLGFVLMLTGWSFVLGSLVTIALAAAYAAYIDVFQIRPEEAALRAHFGAAFDAYRQRVRRWI